MNLEQLKEKGYEAREYFTQGSFGKDFLDSDWFVFDVETTGLSPKTNEIFLLQLYSMDVRKCQFIDFRKSDKETCAKVTEALFKRISRKSVCVIGQNIKSFDLKFLANLIDPKVVTNPNFLYKDTMIVEKSLSQSTRRTSLKALCLKYQVDIPKSDDVVDYINEHKLYTEIKKGKRTSKNKHYDQVPDEIMYPYAMIDCISTGDVYYAQSKLLGT